MRCFDLIRVIVYNCNQKKTKGGSGAAIPAYLNMPNTYKPEDFQGNATKNSYPKEHTKGLFEGMKSQGQTDIVNLVRCTSAGSQKYAAVVWSGDINANFTCLRDQLSAGLNIGFAGIPWWTTDVDPTQRNAS